MTLRCESFEITEEHVKRWANPDNENPIRIALAEFPLFNVKV